jgi:integrase
MSVAFTSRAALSYHYTMSGFTGSWFSNPQTREYHGNPSGAAYVGRYMRSLRRRKTKSGEAPTSAKALTPDDMRALYNFCQGKGNYGARQWVCIYAKQRSFNGTDSILSQLMYVLAYLCLLRADEALRIDMRHIEYPFGQGQKMTLTLDFRKTHQEGGKILDGLLRH